MTFIESNKYEIGNMSDPIDLIVDLFNYFHTVFLNVEFSQVNIEQHCDMKCPSHSLFWLDICPMIQCKCGARENEKVYDQSHYVYDIYVQEVFKLGSEKNNTKNKFFKYYKQSSSVTSNKKCPQKCLLNQVVRKHYLLSNKKYMVFNLNWEGSNNDGIQKIFHMIPPNFPSKELFDFDYE